MKKIIITAAILVFLLKVYSGVSYAKNNVENRQPDNRITYIDITFIAKKYGFYGLPTDNNLDRGNYFLQMTNDNLTIQLPFSGLRSPRTEYNPLVPSDPLPYSIIKKFSYDSKPKEEGEGTMIINQRSGKKYDIVGRYTGSFTYKIK